MWKEFFFRGSLRRQNRERLRGSNEQVGFRTLNGIAQWVSIRGEDPKKPALLLLHGGPGAPDSIFTPQLRRWEQHFNVVQWDQRGAGKTFARSGCVGLSLQQLVEDGLTLAEQLALEFSSVVLVGSSVGSTTGVRMALRRPELFSRYVGVDQNVGGGPLVPRKAFEKRMRALMGSVPGIPHMIKDVIAPAMLTSPQHTWGDMRDIQRGMTASIDALFDELMAFDARAFGMVFDLPVTLIQGDSDVITPPADAKRYFDEITAPKKAFRTIPRTGHLAAMTRPELFLEMLLATE